MTAPEYRLRRLREGDDVSGFTCGNDALDDWLVTTAMRAQRAGTVAVAVLWRTDGRRRAVGYYAICPTEVWRDEHALSSKARAATSRVPGFMLAKLAVARDEQGNGLGRDLLVDALDSICRAAESAGGRMVVVDPVDDAATAFYRKFGFQQIRDQDRMYLLIQDVRASLGLF